MIYILQVFVGVVLLLADGSADDLPWWKTAVLYQVYPRSFKDSDGDGIGDLNGITEKADYFREIGVDAIWLSPINKSPMIDMGYDISNFTDIDPLFGTLADFDALSRKLKRLGIKLLLDFVPNHTSDDHPWFRSATNKSDPLHDDYKDFYVWREPSGWNASIPLPPNNWITVFNEPMWKWCEELQLFYLHQFKVQQPDLNYRNPNVIGNMTDVMDFWMDRGVTGFRVDAPKFLIENSTFRNQPARPGTTGDSYNTQERMYSEEQPETFELMTRWSEHILRRNLLDRVDRALLLEVYDSISVVTKYYGRGNHSFTMPFNFAMTGVYQEFRSHNFKDRGMEFFYSMPEGAISSWVIDKNTSASIYDESYRYESLY